MQNILIVFALCVLYSGSICHTSYGRKEWLLFKSLKTFKQVCRETIIFMKEQITRPVPNHQLLGRVSNIYKGAKSEIQHMPFRNIKLEG